MIEANSIACPWHTKASRLEISPIESATMLRRRFRTNDVTAPMAAKTPIQFFVFKRSIGILQITRYSGYTQINIMELRNFFLSETTIRIVKRPTITKNLYFKIQVNVGNRLSTMYMSMSNTKIFIAKNDQIIRATASLEICLSFFL